MGGWGGWGGGGGGGALCESRINISLAPVGAVFDCLLSGFVSSPGPKVDKVSL